FAAALLMPKLAVMNAFVTRNWDVASCSAEQVFVVAGALGVGYTTLVGYLEGTLRIVAPSHAAKLRKTSPKALRARLLGADTPAGVVVVDTAWQGRPVDVSVGDALLVPAGTSAAGEALDRVSATVLHARAPGAAQLSSGTWTAEVRCMRPDFTGLAEYRHLEASDDV
ncbi:MAG: putative Zn peptidase, partial [Polyangiaceae bacterium]|nr:putative Zn peptidase [Polyangiaceae bacterium]